MTVATPHAAPRLGSLASRITLALALGALALVAWRSLFLIDDAFISFRYARNWAEGFGPVYHPGIEQPVEGYSDLLWVALLALAARCGAAPEIAAHVLSLSAAAGTLVLFQRHLRRRLELDVWSTGLATLALATLPSFGIWASGGLETALFGFLLFACWHVLTRAPQEREVPTGSLAGLLGACLALTRVEGFIWLFGLVLASCVLHRKRPPIRRCGIFLGVSLAAVACQVLWRHAFYGDWVANTVTAKAGFSSATIARGARTLATYGLSFVWPFIALCAAPFLRGERRALALSAALMAGGAIAYNLAVGGDWMPMFRFMAPASAFLALLLALLLARLPHAARIIGGAAAVLIALLPLFDVNLTPRALRESLDFRTFKKGYETEWGRWTTGVGRGQEYELLGRALAQVVRPGETWTGGAIGAVGYYSGIDVLDRNGLVNRAVAQREVQAGTGTAGHEKRVPRVWFKERRPTYYEASIAPFHITGTGPLFKHAVRQLRASVLADPLEAELLNCSIVVAIPLQPGPGLPEKATLLLLRHTNDVQAARGFWRTYQ